jgi:hypothetical protein
VKCGLVGSEDFNAMTAIIMECDDCRTEWECPEIELADQCPNCSSKAIHRKASEAAVNRMRALVGTQKTTPERLITAFAACTTGGESYARAVLTRAVETGYIELIDDTVWRPDPKRR